MFGKRTFGMAIAAALTTAVVGLAGAPAAVSDEIDDDVPQQLEEEILALPWITICEGDEGLLVDAVKHLLTAYVPYEPEFPGYDDHMVERIEYYQELKNSQGADIPVDGTCVSDETWHHFRQDFGEVSQGDRGGRVFFVQLLLVEHGYLDSGQADGIFGPITRAAVVAFQEDTCDSAGNCLAGDGIVGPLTFRALATGGI